MVKSDARSMFGNFSTSLLNDEENALTPAIVGPSSRDSLGLSKYPVRNISISDIVSDSAVQFRISAFDPEHDEEDASLLATMGNPDIGLLQPIMVQEVAAEGKPIGPFGQGKNYSMVFGHRRLACARRLGWEKIQAHVSKAGENVSAFTLTENSGGKEPTSYEKAMALRKFFEVNPLATQQDIVAITGWSQSYISRLTAAVSGDTPQQLCDIFAKGLQPMTVILLKPVFIAADPSTRDQLAQSLSGCTLATAQSISDSFQKGMSPSAVVDFYCDTKTTPIVSGSEQSALVVENSASSIFTPSEDKSVKTENPSGVVSAKPVPSVVSNPTHSVQAQSANPGSRLPSGIRPENYAIVEALALENGTSNALVKALIVKAITLDLDREELENACLISAKCNDADLAVFYLTKIMSDHSSFSAFRQYAKSVRLTIKSIYRREKSHSFEVSKALREGVFSPLPLAPRKSDKKS